eukprot:7710492-Pyramimonas_sp.AAC.1
MAKFEELADAPTQDDNAREAPEAEPPQPDGRLPTMYEGSEADLEAHLLDVKCTELQGEQRIVGGSSIRLPLHCAPTYDH